MRDRKLSTFRLRRQVRAAVTESYRAAPFQGWRVTLTLDADGGAGFDFARPAGTFSPLVAGRAGVRGPVP